MGRRRFTEEFKREAVRQAMQPGMSKSQVARDLEIHGNLLRRWLRERAPSKDGPVAKADAIASALAQENQRVLRKYSIGAALTVLMRRGSAMA